MIITRGMFFKVLAALGFGQASSNPQVKLCVSGEAIGPCPTPCAEGEESCPLGHCQKPKLIYPVEYVNDGPMEGAQFVNANGKLHTCTVCGIVYVPLEVKK